MDWLFQYKLISLWHLDRTVKMGHYKPVTCEKNIEYWSDFVLKMQKIEIEDFESVNNTADNLNVTFQYSIIIDRQRCK